MAVSFVVFKLAFIAVTGGGDLDAVAVALVELVPAHVAASIRPGVRPFARDVVVFKIAFVDCSIFPDVLTLSW